METPNMTLELDDLAVVEDKPPEEWVAEIPEHEPELPTPTDELDLPPVIPEELEPEPQLPTQDKPQLELSTIIDETEPEVPTLYVSDPASPKFDQTEPAFSVSTEKPEPVLEDVSLQEPEPEPVSLSVIPEPEEPKAVENGTRDKPEPRPRPVASDELNINKPEKGIGGKDAFERKKSKSKMNVESTNNEKEYKKNKVATSGISAALKIVRLMFTCCIPHAAQPPSKMYNSQRPSKANLCSPLDKTARGKLGEVKEADEEIKKLFKAIESTFRGKLLEEKPDLAPNESFRVTQYRTQIVVGMNYFTKIRINDGPNYVHARIYKPVEGKPWLTSILPNQTEQNDIDYF